MKLRLIVLITLVTGIGSGFSVWGQTASFKFINKSSADLKANIGSVDEAKYKKALAIYNKLVEARGDRRFPVPPFVMTKEEANVAFLEADGLSIGLEEKAYDICMKMGEEEGENAIAALLGHELTHFYEKHQWRVGFANAYSDLSVGMKLQGSVGLDKLNNETQADYLGGFLAYSAGYQVFNKMPELYDALYAESGYNLNEEMPGYASKDDRKALAVKSEDKIRVLVEVYEMANLLTALGRYNAARLFYKHILTQYQGREIYNNLGVLTTLEAISYFSPAELKYRLPLELDLSFARGSKDGFAEKEAKRKQLLEEAVIYFTNAVSMDPEYAPGYLNLACAYYLLDDAPRANFYAGVEATRRAAEQKELYEKTITDAKVLMALLRAKEGKEDRAIKMLEPLKEESGAANYNYALMTATPLPKGKKEDGPEDEEIDKISIKRIREVTLNNRRNDEEVEFFGAIEFHIWDENVPDLKHSKIYRYEPPSGVEEPDIYIHITKEGYPDESYFGDFKVGTTRKELVEVFGEPNFSLEAVGGEIMVYEEMLFIMDSNQKVKRWAHYLFVN